MKDPLKKSIERGVPSYGTFTTVAPAVKQPEAFSPAKALMRGLGHFVSGVATGNMNGVLTAISSVITPQQ